MSRKQSVNLLLEGNESRGGDGFEYLTRRVEVPEQIFILVQRKKKNGREGGEMDLDRE